MSRVQYPPTQTSNQYGRIGNTVETTVTVGGRVRVNPRVCLCV